MVNVITFYLDQNLMVVSATIHSEEFVLIELVYPLKGITADYYSESGNFLAPENLHKIKEFSMQICKAYRDLIGNRQSLMDCVDRAKVAYPTETIEMAIHSFLVLQFEANLNRAFFSSNSYNLLFKNYLNSLDLRSFQDESEGLSHPVDLQIKNALKSIIDAGVTDIVIFPFKDNSPVLTLDLSTQEVPEEKLLPELIISSPLFWDGEQGKEVAARLLAERFNTFTDQKKLTLFILRNTRKDLFLYNKMLETW